MQQIRQELAELNEPVVRRPDSSGDFQGRWKVDELSDEKVFIVLFA